jgi:hypothetical protein
MKVLEILKKAEDELREAIAESARAGDYRDVDVGRSVAINIKEMRERISGNGQIVGKTALEKSQRTTKTKRKKYKRRGKPEGLPRFEVRNGSLYKYGWSRKRKDEYYHQVSLSAFDAVVNAMAELTKESTGPFTAEEIIACTEEMIPAYQVYVVLAALRSLDAISQVGREGYDIPVDISEKAKDMWRNLTVK